MRAVKAKHLRKMSKAASGNEPVSYDEKPHVVKITTGELNEGGTRKIVSVMRHTRVLKADCQRALYQTLKSMT